MIEEKKYFPFMVEASPPRAIVVTEWKTVEINWAKFVHVINWMDGNVSRFFLLLCSPLSLSLSLPTVNDTTVCHDDRPHRVQRSAVRNNDRNIKTNEEYTYSAEPQAAAAAADDGFFLSNFVSFER